MRSCDEGNEKWASIRCRGGDPAARMCGHREYRERIGAPGRCVEWVSAEPLRAGARQLPERSASRLRPDTDSADQRRWADGDRPVRPADATLQRSGRAVAPGSIPDPEKPMAGGDWLALPLVDLICLLPARANGDLGDQSRRLSSRHPREQSAPADASTRRDSPVPSRLVCAREAVAAAARGCPAPSLGGATHEPPPRDLGGAPVLRITDRCRQ